MKGFKGFNSKLQCTPEGKIFQYEIGKEYQHPGNVNWCHSGFHFCEDPLAVFGFYSPSDSRFAEIEADDVLDQTDESTKRVAKKLSIKAELSLSAFVGLGVKFILDKVDFKNAPATNTGYRSAATNTGYRSAATNTGDQSAATNTGDQSAATNTGYQSAATNTGYRSAATNTGYRSAATNTGEEGYAASLGVEGKAKGSIGCWLTLAEWEEKTDGWHRIDVQTRVVDGITIKADTFYQLRSGKFTETE